MENTELKKVKVVRDESGHWYVIPNEMSEEFRLDSEDDAMIDNGKFDEKYGEYRTGGCLNLIQLYAKI